MGTKFASAKFAHGFCDRCGFRAPLKELRRLVIKTQLINIKVCNECWEADHPQLKLGMYPVFDPQALENPRPDTSYVSSGVNAEGSRIFQWGWNPVGGASSIDSPLTKNDLVCQCKVGNVAVTVT